MKFFNPIIINSPAQDPYKNNNKYIEKKRADKFYNQKQYTKITYSREHKSSLWKVKNAFLALLGYISVIPLILDKKGVDKLWKRAKTGEEKRVVLVAKQNLPVNPNPPQGNSSSQQPTNPNDTQLASQVKTNPLPTQTAAVNQNPPKKTQITPVIKPNPVTNVVLSEDAKIQKRTWPPRSLMDNVLFKGKDGLIVEKNHDKDMNIFKDEEILEQLDIQNISSFNEMETILIKYTANNKPIIQQQGKNAGVATASAMLIFERGGEVNIEAIVVTTFGTDNDMKDWIEAAGFKPLLIKISQQQNYLKELRTLIQKNGSAIVSIEGKKEDEEKFNAHALVVDDISEDLQRVRLRDPYHGWEITVSGASFMQRIPSSSVIQIE